MMQMQKAQENPGGGSVLAACLPENVFLSMILKDYFFDHKQGQTIIFAEKLISPKISWCSRKWLVKIWTK